MIDFDILNEAGTTNERLREIFTAKNPSIKRAAKLTQREKKEIERDIKIREKFEVLISSWINEHVIFSLDNHHIYSAVDLAWDSAPINKKTFPLMLYAQGRIDIRKCADSLRNLADGETYVQRNDKGKIIDIKVPKFAEVNVNLMRSVIMRRLSAQSNKYNNLWPFFKYEPRRKTSVGKLRADATSQRMDIMADQYDYRHFQTQVIRDMFLYGRCVAFPRASWEREVQWEKRNMSDEFTPGSDTKIPKEARVTKEGVCWFNPHPSRVFWDNNFPLSSINQDNGPEYIGYWDVVRWGDVSRNANYFNRDSVYYSADTAAWFTHYSVYFNQYLDKITPPDMPRDAAGANDRKSNVGLYTAALEQTATFVTDIFIKVIPKKWRIGKYPFPVWLHLKVAGDTTVIFAEIMPSSPAAVFSFNENDGRLVNISMAHELMPYQDQLTNLFTQLLETTKRDLFTVAMLNTDVFPDTDEGRKARDQFVASMESNNFYAGMAVLKASFAKYQELGIDVTPDNIFRIIRAEPNTQMSAIFQSITQLLLMVERLMALSPQEQGQPAPREISATETNLIANTTESVYTFISDAIDEGRGAMKRIIYESHIALGSNDIELPIIADYPDDVIEAAGFSIVGEEAATEGEQYKIISGTKAELVYDYIFTSRDGSDRPSNNQSATVLVEMLRSVGQLPPEAGKAILSAMGKEKLFEIYNEIFRLVGAGVSLKLSVKPGESNELLLEDEQQLIGMIQQLAEKVAANTDRLNELTGGAPPAETTGGQPPAASPPLSLLPGGQR